MAKRLKTRVSAGAALVTGIGMMGIATAAPAQAETTMQYSCDLPFIGAQTFDVTLDTDAPESATVGEEMSITPSGAVTINETTADTLRGIEWAEIAGDIPDVDATISNGTDSVVFTTDLTIPSTEIPETGTVDLTINGEAQTASVSEVGEYTVSAPDSFTATFTGTTADGEDGLASPITTECTYVEGSGSQTIDTLTVTEDDGGEEPDEPEVNDWFEEPSSLPLVDNVFTVAGTANQAGTLSIEVLSGTGEGEDRVPDEVLETYTWEVEEGEVESDFDLVENADFVRIISEDCVDANGKTGEDPHVDEEGVGNGCSVLYTAPWASDDDSGDGDMDNGDDDSGTGDDAGDDDGAGDDAADDGAGEPEVPEVVQTDGVEAAGSQQDTTLALALGGLLLAGAGAGTVLVARRRAAGQS